MLWARARTRNGRIALLILGGLLFALGMALASGTGLSAAILAVRSGRAQDIARTVLTSLFVQAVLASVILGFGMNEVFSDFELRRYPINALDRHLTRNLIAIVDPFWFLVLAAYAALASGMYLLGAASLSVGLVAALLLFFCNYVFARACGLIIDRLVRIKVVPALFVAGILGFAVGKRQMPRLIARYPAPAKTILGMLHYTPSAGAASAMTTTGLEALGGLAVVFCWLICLCAATAVLERQAGRPHTPDRRAIASGSIFDRIAACFGPKDAPLIGYWLRFYLRNSRIRAYSFIALPLVALFIGALGKGGPRNLFLAALGVFPLGTFVNVDRFTVNQFGYSDSGVRRYFLLPVDPGSVLRTASSVSLLLGSPIALLAAIGWAVWAPPPFDARMLFMLIASSITGMLVFRGLGLWSSVLAPRRCRYDQFRTMGDPMSFLGALVLIGSILGCLLGPAAALDLAPALVSPAFWWLAPLPTIPAFLFYAYSLRVTGALLRRRRERLIATVEGNN